MKKILLVLSAGLSSLHSQTLIPDLSQVSGNWNLTGSPYIILGRATVPIGQILSIDPGVTIKFAAKTNLMDTTVWQPDSNLVGRLRVDGKILANGTASDTINFTANNAGYWGSVYLTGFADSTSSFTFCKFSYMNRIAGYNTGTGFELHKGLNYQKPTAFSVLHCGFENNQFTISDEMSFRTLAIGFCNFRNNYDSLSYYYFDQSTDIDNPPVYVYNCKFNNSTISGRRLTIVNSILQNADSIALVSWSGGPSLCTVINSLLYNNPHAFQGQCLFDLYNSILLNNTTYDTMTMNCGISWHLEKTVFDGALSGSWQTSTSNYSFNNPAMVNPAPVNGDFHLLGSSICINGGDTIGISSLIPSTDLDGNPRYNGAIDIGPYEYQSGVGVSLIEKPIGIYPNPSSKFLNIECNLVNAQLRIIDVLGTEIEQKIFSSNYSIDISSLPSGIYFVNVTAGGRTISSKFIKE